jgi:FkbH-like protein
VHVVEVPADPADYVRALDQALRFERLALTAEDAQRTVQYQQEQVRRVARETAGSIADYQSSLNMVAHIEPINEANLQRVEQLIGKTNQFNLTTRRHTRADVIDLISRDGAISLCLQLKDRFGDYGLISVLIAAPRCANDPRTLEIDTWLMSCRAIGRTVEGCLFNSLLKRALGEHADRLHGVYIPTAKNELVRDLYHRLGLEEGERSSDGTIVYDLELARARPATTYVALES